MNICQASNSKKKKQQKKTDHLTLTHNMIKIHKY